MSPYQQVRIFQQHLNSTSQVLTQSPSHVDESFKEEKEFQKDIKCDCLQYPILKRHHTFLIIAATHGIDKVFFDHTNIPLKNLERTFVERRQTAFVVLDKQLILVGNSFPSTKIQ